MSVGVRLGVGVWVNVGLGVGVGLWVAVAVGVRVGWRVAVAVGVRVDVGLIVGVRVELAVRVGLALGGGATVVVSSLPPIESVGLEEARASPTVAVISSRPGVELEVTGGGCDEPGPGRRIQKSAKSSRAAAANPPPITMGDGLRFDAGPGGEMATEPSPTSDPVAAL